MTEYTVRAVPGIGEVQPGTDLAAAVLERAAVQDGDVLVVTSKVVSKAEGRVVRGTRDEAIAGETDRVVARRGGTAIVRTRHGLVMAAAGVDTSNTAADTVVLLPADPDRSARDLRRRVREESGKNVAVVVSDTSGRAWRNGQTDIAIGAAGLVVLDDHAGRTDAYGNLLAVTAPALADELAAAGDLAKGKLAGTPVALVRGLARLVLPPGTDGPGADVLVRDEATDMFGLGAREAVVAAILGGTARGFGAAASRDDLVRAVASVAGTGLVLTSRGESQVDVEVVLDDPLRRGRLGAQVEALARAHGWTVRSAGGATDGRRLVLVPGP